jgi:hypothetical protein
MLLPTDFQPLGRAVNQGHHLGLIDVKGKEELTYCGRATGT